MVFIFLVRFDLVDILVVYVISQLSVKGIKVWGKLYSIYTR